MRRSSGPAGTSALPPSPSIALRKSFQAANSARLRSLRLAVRLAAVVLLVMLPTLWYRSSWNPNTQPQFNSSPHRITTPNPKTAVTTGSSALSVSPPHEYRCRAFCSGRTAPVTRTVHLAYDSPLQRLQSQSKGHRRLLVEPGWKPAWKRHGAERRGTHRDAFDNVFEPNGWTYQASAEKAGIVWREVEMPGNDATQLRSPYGSEILETLTDKGRLCRRVSALYAAGITVAAPLCLVAECRTDPAEIANRARSIGRASGVAAGSGDDEAGGCWVVKATAMSRSTGVARIDVNDRSDLTALRSAIHKRCGNASSTDADAEIVVQQCIAPPLLWDGDQVELRWYWMIAFGHVFLYADPLVRRTSQRNLYDAHRQNATTTLDALLANTKLRRHALVNAVRDILGALVGEVEYRPRYQLLGLDIIVDAAGVPWVTEVQRGPSMVIATNPVKKVLFPQWLTNAFDVALRLFKSAPVDKHEVAQWDLGNLVYVRSAALSSE